MLRISRYTAAHLPETASELAAGGMNVHVPITFDDGVKWLARIRKPHFHGPPSDMMKVVVESEVETMRVLSEISKLVPNAFLPHTEKISKSTKTGESFRQAEPM